MNHARTLEVARWMAMIAGAICAVVAATWFRFATYDDDSSLLRAKELSAIFMFVVASALFARAYWSGTQLRALPSKADLWDRGVAWIEDHGAIPALLILTIASGVMFSGVFVGESIGDDLTFHMAESARLADCIREGDWDLWNPSANGGYATAYYYQVIPQLASALPTALFGNHLFWFQLSLWFPLVIVAPAAYRGMRLMGATPWQSVAAAFAVTFISGGSRWGSGADGSFQVGLYTQTWALAVFPLGLGYGVRYLVENTSLPAAIAWGALVFLCHPFASIALCLGLAVGVLAHYLQFTVRDALLKKVLLGVFALAIAVLLYKLVTDRPVPPEGAPDTPVAPIKYIYLPLLILAIGLVARVAASGRLLAAVLMIGVVLAFGANLIAYALVAIVPKRPEGVTIDLPPEWDLGVAANYIGPLLLLYALGARLAIAARPLHVVPRSIAGACLFALTCAIVFLGVVRSEAKIAVAAIVPLTSGILVVWPTRGTAPVDEVAAPGGPARGRDVLCAAVLLGLACGCSLVGVAKHQLWLAACAPPLFGGFLYFAWRVRKEPFVRLVILGLGLAIATMPGWLTVILDRDGFGGFPHRVSDEVGPGYKELMRWYTRGGILDHNRVTVLTWCLPLVLVFGRMQFARWLWTPGLVFGALLALGPHAPKTADDLLPAVRFLGAMQVVLALGVGAGAFAMMRALWDAGPDSVPLRILRAIAGRRSQADLVYALRTVIIAISCALVVFVGLMGSRVLSQRVSTLEAFDYRGEMYEMISIIEKQPQGKKQVGPGCENHWWNMLSYVYAKRPSLLQMGGGGLQASPNYDFVYSVREFPKLAWVYDVPLFLFAKASGGAPDGEKLGETSRYELRRLPAPGIVSPIQITGVLPEGESRAGSAVRLAAIEWLKSPDPLSDHHLAYFGHGGLFQAPDAKVLRAFRVDPSPDDLADIYAEVDVKQPTTFVARESWHPRWHAYVDGVEVPIRRVTPDFPAIDVPPGKHVLAFRFERPWWAHAAWLAWPGITLAAWYVLRRLRRKHQLPRAELVS